LQPPVFILLIAVAVIQEGGAHRLNAEASTSCMLQHEGNHTAMLMPEKGELQNGSQNMSERQDASSAALMEGEQQEEEEVEDVQVQQHEVYDHQFAVEENEVAEQDETEAEFDAEDTRTRKCPSIFWVKAINGAHRSSKIKPKLEFKGVTTNMTEAKSPRWEAGGGGGTYWEFAIGLKLDSFRPVFADGKPGTYLSWEARTNPQIDWVTQPTMISPTARYFSWMEELLKQVSDANGAFKHMKDRLRAVIRKGWKEKMNWHDNCPQWVLEEPEAKPILPKCRKRSATCMCCYERAASTGYSFRKVWVRPHQFSKWGYVPGVDDCPWGYSEFVPADYDHYEPDCDRTTPDYTP